MTRFRQLTIEERYHIQFHFELGLSLRQIAKALNRAASTISRELRRNRQSPCKYWAPMAQDKADDRRKNADKQRITDAWLIEQVHYYLTQYQWSPEQISGYLARMHSVTVSHEWIYQYLLRDKAQGGELYKHLRHKVRKTRRRYGSQDRRGRIIGRVGIEQRPDVVDTRQRLGDWEADSVQGKRLATLVTLVERKTGLSRIRKVMRSTAELTASAMIDAFSGMVVKSTTSDNGKEFSHHHKVSQAMGCSFFFARPYHSWERGTNENTNGLIRQYFPKGTAFEDVTDEEIQRVEDKLNHRPRKRHGFQSPLEMLKAEKLKLGVAVNT